MLQPWTVFYTGEEWGWAWFDGIGFSDGYPTRNDAHKAMLKHKFNIR